MKRDTITGLFVIVVLLGLYSINKVNLGYSIPDEKRYIQSTKEMEASGDYITPRYHGALRFQKPILFYWLIILSYKIFGVTIFGARFPSILAALLAVVTVYFLTRVFFSKKGALFSGLILATCEVFFIYARFAVTDITFILFITLAVYSFAAAYLGHIKGRFRYLYMYIFMALAVLTKGPLGFFYPALTIVVFILMRRDYAAVKEMNIAPGMAIFAAISAPWFIAMIALHKEYLNSVWSLEIMKKLNVAAPGGWGNTLLYYLSSVFYYFGMVLLRNLPWTIFLPAAFFSLRRRVMFYGEKEKTGLCLIFSWFLVVFAGIVAVWSRESYYVLPLSVPLAIFIGAYLADLTEENNLYRSAFFSIPFILVIIACIIGFAVWTFVSFYVFDKPVFSFSLLMWLLPAGMLAAYFLRHRKKILLPVSMYAAAIISLGYFAGCVLPVISDDPLERFAEDIKQVIKEGDLVGTDSESVSYHRLNVYMDAYNVANIKKDSLNEFLSDKNKRVFYLVSENRYGVLVPDPLKKRLYICDKAVSWKRLDKQYPGYFATIASYIMQNKRESVKEALREKIYLVSNQP